ncbi:MAG: tRNA pseudouridine(55) synthase TruB [Gammaproteobacteria bacterium]|nr:tRNA pseudouridine(55) synthase TruB [Gammaproteobacteria bacterium]
MAKRRSKGRDVDGILLLDKPQGLTSNEALQKVKRLFQARKAGHTGSLDPLATGMLPVCFGEATKISNFLLNADKRYLALCKLGIRTDSADADGQVIETRSAAGIREDEIRRVLLKFLGEQLQVPPMHSAIKQHGVPLYKLAHQGIEVEREARTITVHRLELVRFEKDMLELDISCSKGTYIRALADDIGKTLGCGAHIAGLRRLQVGVFENAKMFTPEELNKLQEQGFTALDQALLPVDAGLGDWDDVRLSPDAAFYLRQGQAVFIPRLKIGGYVRLYDSAGVFLGIGLVLDDGRVAPKRLMSMLKMG